MSLCLAGGAAEREKVPANPEALLLMASSQRDMEDWVQAIRRVIWAPLGGGTSRSSHAHPVEPLSTGNLVLLPHTHKFSSTWDLLGTSCMSDGSLVLLLLFLKSCLPPSAKPLGRGLQYPNRGLWPLLACLLASGHPAECCVFSQGAGGSHTAPCSYPMCLSSPFPFPRSP